MKDINEVQVLDGFEKPKVPTHRHVFQVAVYTSVSRETAMNNLAKLFDKHNQENMARGMRPDMAVAEDERLVK